MKPLKPFRQSPGLCGPASLKILLSHYGKEYTETELAQLCLATAEHGTSHKDLIQAIKKLGGDPIEKAGATIDEIKAYVDQDIPVIVGWWSADNDPDDHFSVVYAVDEKGISMMDPELDEGTRTLSHKAFEQVWYDFDGPENKRVDRWMVAVASWFE